MPPSAAAARGDVAVDRRLVGEVAFARMRLDAVLADLRRGCVERVLAARADRDVGAAGREAERDRAADALAAAGDDDLLALETDLHGVPFLLSGSVLAGEAAAGKVECSQAKPAG